MDSEWDRMTIEYCQVIWARGMLSARPLFYNCGWLISWDLTGREDV